LVILSWSVPRQSPPNPAKGGAQVEINFPKVELRRAA
jgi:hypothetical protein